MEFISLKNIFANFGKWQWRKDASFQRFSNYQIINSQTPVLIGCDEPLTPYKDCPYLRIAIDKKAEMFANGMWKCVSIDDETKEFNDDEGLLLLRKPNTFQSGEDFLAQYIVYKELFANNFIFKLSGSKFAFPKQLKHLPSDLMEISFTGKFFRQTELKDIIKTFYMNVGSEKEPYTIEEVIYKPTNFSFAEGKGLSKIPSLQLPISNIIAALKTRNIIAVEKGSIGILTSDAADAAGSRKLTPKEKEAIDNQFKSDNNLYSSKGKIKVSETPMKWQHMSYPTKELALFEEIEEDFGAILGAFGLDRDIFPSTAGATNENKEKGLKHTYQNTIQPEADSLGNVLSNELGATEIGRKYILDYSWLPVMQEDKGSMETADKTKAERLNIMLNSAIIDREDFAKEMNVKGSQLNLRSLVGSLTGIVEINTAVANGDMDREAAVAVMVNQFGYEQSIAEKMITKTVKPLEQRTGAKPRTPAPTE